MRLKSLIKISLKNFWSRRMRAILTILAVTIGISAIIFLISLGYGLERLVTSQVVNFDAFTVIDLTAENTKVQKLNSITNANIAKIGHVTSTAPLINLAGRIKTPDTESTVEAVIQSSNLSYIKMAGTLIKSGEWYAENDGQVVINRVLANLLFKQGTEDKNIIGKQLNADLIIGRDYRAADEEEGSIIKELPVLTISGITEEGQSPITYINLKTAKDAGVINYSSLKLKIDSKDNVEMVRKALENLGYSTEYVGDTIKQISDIFTYFRIILGAFGLIALIVASLGTFNTLTISLLERIREIGLLKVIGMQSKDIYQMFIIESLFIGFVGGTIGVALGYLNGLLINFILHALATRAEAEAITIFYTPWTLAFYVSLFSIAVGFITGWYPARRAVKTNALDAIRYE